MIEASRAPSPESLGCLSQEDLATSFEALGAERDTFVYRRAALVCRGLPFLAEVAFAYAPDEAGRQLYAGLNFSPSIVLDPFPDLDGQDSLQGVLGRLFVESSHPVIVLAHLTAPRLSYLVHRFHKTDRLRGIHLVCGGL